MQNSIKIITCYVLSFFFAMTISPLILKIAKSLNIKQTTLFYVDNHTQKSGTPTMGGFIFIIPMVIIGGIYIMEFKSIGFVAIYITLSYGLVGFLDDFLKIKQKTNKGLSPTQKIIAQTIISIIISVYCYTNKYIGSSINLPFINITIDFKYWYIPFTIFSYIASVNAVNLTDGLDGLATKTGIAYLSSFLLILTVLYYKNFEMSQEYLFNDLSMIYYTSSLLGGLFAFLWYNSYPAKIFMGDTGSLALGGAITSVAVFSKNPLLILFIGIMYVVTCISVIVQVVSFKFFKTRVLKMAPLHHHLEYKGIKESKIVSYYTIITIIFGVLSLYSFL